MDILLIDYLENPSPIHHFFLKIPPKTYPKWVKMSNFVSGELLQQLFKSKPTTNREKIYGIMITTQKHLLGYKIPLSGMASNDLARRLQDLWATLYTIHNLTAPSPHTKLSIWATVVLFKKSKSTGRHPTASVTQRKYAEVTPE